MKKIVTVSILFTLSIISVIIFFLEYRKIAENKSVERTIEEAKEINKNSYMGMEYLELSGLSEEEVKKYNKDHPRMKSTNDDYVNGYFYKIPEDTVDIRLIQISITGGNYHVFGIYVGDDLDQAVKILKQRGYKKCKPETNVNNDGMVRTLYQKDLAVIMLETEIDSQIIKEFSILTDVNKYSYSFFNNVRY